MRKFFIGHFYEEIGYLCILLGFEAREDSEKEEK